MKKNKINKWIKIIILFIYLILTLSHSLFNKSNLNIFLSTKMFIAHFYSFPIFFGSIFSIISFILVLVYGVKLLNNDSRNSKLYDRDGLYNLRFNFIYYLIFLVASIIFVIFSTNSTKVNEDSIEKNKKVKIVEWNCLENLSTKYMIDIFKEFDADIAVFPELDGIDDKYFEDINLDINDYQIFVSDRMYGISPVTIVVKKEFSKYDLKKTDRQTTFGTVHIESKDYKFLDVIGVHTAPPIPSLMNLWENDLDLIYENYILRNPNSIIIGDFNATLRHGSLNKIESHIDLLEYNKKNNRGTWNSSFPKYLQTTIDHILVPKDIFHVDNIEIKEYEESDHLALFFELKY